MDNLTKQEIYLANKREYERRYYQENKEKLSKYNREYSKKYYHENKEELIKIKSRQITCECGKKIKYYSLPLHRRAKQHIQWVNENPVQTSSQ